MRTLMMVAAALLAISFTASAAEQPEKKIKIYIHTDMEGVAGINTFEMMQRDAPTYRKCCELLMEDLNAAIDGAFAGGADHVTVLDSHGGGKNFIHEMLDKRAEVDTKPNGKWWGIMDETYSGTFFIGAHAMMGTMNAFLDHTQNSTTVHDYSVNGRKFGELAQWAMVAGNWGVPMLMVSGDEAAIVEARQFFHPLETAVVKRGIGRNRAELVEIKEARARIREAAKRAISLIGEAKPFVPAKPMEIILKYNRADYCDTAAKRTGNERIDARTIRKFTSDPLELFP